MSATVFILRGEVDLASFAAVEDALGRAIDGSQEDVVVDCGELIFMDSSGVAVLCRAEERMRAAGRTMHITNANAATRRLLELLGLMDRMVVEPTEV
jgi:anti-sigma B factor antagonist